MKRGVVLISESTLYYLRLEPPLWNVSTFTIVSSVHSKYLAWQNKYSHKDVLEEMLLLVCHNCLTSRIVWMDKSARYSLIHWLSILFSLRDYYSNNEAGVSSRILLYWPPQPSFFSMGIGKNLPVDFLFSLAARIVTEKKKKKKNYAKGFQTLGPWLP